MGASNGRDFDKPVHRVSVESFWMDRTEVTVAAYRQCVDAGGCSVSGVSEQKECNWPRSDRGSYPINCVDWSQASAFCQWAGKRLPTEPEWEYAARGGDEGRVFPWGSSPDERRACVNAADTCPVGSFPSGASKDGLQDMAGNVWEWTATRECKYLPSGCEASSSEQHIRRGGSFYSDLREVHSASRFTAHQNARDYDLGFRCALTEG